MIASISVSFATPLSEMPDPRAPNRLEIEARDDAGRLRFEASYECAPTNTGLLDSLYAADAVLAGEPRELLVCSYDDRAIVLDAPDDDLVLSVRDAQTGEQRDVDDRLRVDAVAVVEGLLEFAGDYREQRIAAGLDRACAVLRLDVAIAHAERSLRHAEEYGSTDGFEPSMDRDHLESFVLDCRRNDELREHVLRTTALEDLVADLADSADDECAETCYRQLLGRTDTIADRTAAALVDHPDPRATSPLLGVLWSDPTGSRAVVEALARVPSRDVLLDLGDVVGRHADDAPDVALTAAEALQSTAIREHLDADDLERLESALFEGLEATDDVELEAELRRVLDDLA